MFNILESGCKAPTQRQNGWVMTDAKKQNAMLFCPDGYLSAGSTMAYCDGQQWDRELGECRQDIGYSKICDFETVDLCEWTQDSNNDFPWVRRSGWNSFEKLEFGPKHDHTVRFKFDFIFNLLDKWELYVFVNFVSQVGQPLEGHYMVAEATNSRSTHKSRFWSPIHKQLDSENACLRFYYHMYGSKIGQLRVILKPINENIDDIADEPK